MRTTFASVLGFLVLAGTIGCGEKGGGTAPTSASGSAGGSAGGGGAVAAETIDPKNAVGTWLLDTKDIAEMMKPMMEMAKSMAEMLPAGPEKDKAMKEFGEKFGGFDKMKFVVTLKKDGTMDSDVNMPGDAAQTGTGVWTQSGDTVTVTAKTFNGKPTEGHKAEPLVFTLKDGTLSGSADGMPMVFHRK